MSIQQKIVTQLNREPGNLGKRIILNNGISGMERSGSPEFQGFDKRQLRSSLNNNWKPGNSPSQIQSPQKQIKSSPGSKQQSLIPLNIQSYNKSSITRKSMNDAPASNDNSGVNMSSQGGTPEKTWQFINEKLPVPPKVQFNDQQIRSEHKRYKKPETEFSISNQRGYQQIRNDKKVGNLSLGYNHSLNQSGKANLLEKQNTQNDSDTPASYFNKEIVLKERPLTNHQLGSLSNHGNGNNGNGGNIHGNQRLEFLLQRPAQKKNNQSNNAQVFLPSQKPLQNIIASSGPKGSISQNPSSSKLPTVQESLNETKESPKNFPKTVGGSRGRRQSMEPARKKGHNENDEYYSQQRKYDADQEKLAQVKVQTQKLLENTPGWKMNKQNQKCSPFKIGSFDKNSPVSEFNQRLENRPDIYLETNIKAFHMNQRDKFPKPLLPAPNHTTTSQGVQKLIKETDEMNIGKRAPSALQQSNSTSSLMSKRESKTGMGQRKFSNLEQELSSSSSYFKRNQTQAKSRQDLSQNLNPLPDSQTQGIQGVQELIPLAAQPQACELSKYEKILISPPVKKVYAKTRKGNTSGGYAKLKNQDSMTKLRQYAGFPNSSFYAVFDGHGQYGELASDFAAKNLPNQILDLASRLTRNDILPTTIKNHQTRKSGSSFGDRNMMRVSSPTSSWKPTMGQTQRIKTPPRDFFYATEHRQARVSSIKEAFQVTHKQMSKRAFDSAFSGTTACCVILSGTKLISANCGDSRAIIARAQNINQGDSEKWIHEQLTTDHKPCLLIEQDRITRSGGRVEAYRVNGDFVGPKRVWLKKDNMPGLAMSRSLGDTIAHTVGVLAEPEVREQNLSEDDKFIVIASDGVWEFMTNQLVLDIVIPFWYSDQPEAACDAVVQESLNRWNHANKKEGTVDDITVIIIFLNHSRFTHPESPSTSSQESPVKPEPQIRQQSGVRNQIQRIMGKNNIARINAVTNNHGAKFFSKRVSMPTSIGTINPTSSSEYMQ